MVWFVHDIQGTNPHIFLTSIWWVWRARNSKCIAKEHVPHCQPRLTILNYATISLDCFGKSETSQRAHRSTCFLAPSRDQVILFYVDGSSFGNLGPLGFNRLFRDNNGTWIMGSPPIISMLSSLPSYMGSPLRGIMEIVVCFATRTP